MSSYRIVFSKQDLGYRISTLYRQKQFSIGILDFGTKEDLVSALDWYLANMNLSVHVLSTEFKMEQYDITKDYPEVTFIVFKNDTTTGEFINAMSDECYTDYFFIVRSDMEVVAFDGESLLKAMGGKDHPVAIAPVMLSSSLEVMPTIRAPYIRGKEIDPQSFQPDTEDVKLEPTLYPVLCSGLYDRALFQRLRGYDTEILGEYYQSLDMGVRSWLFGYKMFVTRSLAVRFPNRVSIIEDRSECIGMNRFYTKAFSIKRIAGKNLVGKWKPFVDKKVLTEEVKKKQINLQKTDIFTLVDNWGEK